MNHTSQCLEAMERRQREREEYATLWPHHCKRCEGAGGTSYSYDPSPSGVGLSPGGYWEFEPCEACDGHCPRCGAEAPQDWVDGGSSTCTHCGWSWGHHKGDVCPPPYEDCYCEVPPVYSPRIRAIILPDRSSRGSYPPGQPF